MAGTGISVGDKPRPRVALLGLKPGEVTALKAFFPTSYEGKFLQDLPKLASPKELDLIVSAATDGEIWQSKFGDDDAERYAGVHLILLGANAWARGQAPLITKLGNGPLFVVRGESSSVKFTLSPDLGPLFEPVSTSLGDSALHKPLIELVKADFGGWVGVQESWDEPWLAWAWDPELPLAISLMRPEINRGLAWFPTRPNNVVDLVRGIVRAWAEVDRPSFPGIVPWAESIEWMSDEELAVRDEQIALLKEFEAVRQGYIARINTQNETFAAARDKANNGPRAMLTAQDKVLVIAVAGVFRDLGFQVTSTDETRDPKAQKREDLLLRDAGVPNWVALVEVKGKKRSGASPDDLSKIERHVRNYVLEEKRLPSMQVFVCNTQYELAPDARFRPFHNDAETIKHFCEDDPALPGLIIPTPELYQFHRDRNTIGLEKAREIIRTSRGVFQYPEPEPKPKKGKS